VRSSAHPTGSITVFTGSHSHGQGRETTFAQLVADRFGVPLEMVDIVHGDTGQVPFGMGTYASRSLVWPISTRVNKPENDDPSIVEANDLSAA
jgi:CO/xanthine dehydrogenase Mo-binding subunit